MFNDFGYGLPEKFFQKAFAQLLEREKIPFERELFLKLNYQGKDIGKYFIDFLIDQKIIIELKVRPQLGYVHVRQVNTYLKSSNLKLAILIYFTREGVKYRRIVNG